MSIKKGYAYRPSTYERVFFEPNGYVEGLAEERAIEHAASEALDPLELLLLQEEEDLEYSSH